MTLLGSLTRDGLGYRSKDGRWFVGQMEHCGRWFAYDGDDEWPITGDGFRTLRDAKSAVEEILLIEACRPA